MGLSKSNAKKIHAPRKFIPLYIPNLTGQGSVHFERSAKRQPSLVDGFGYETSIVLPIHPIKIKKRYSLKKNLAPRGLLPGFARKFGETPEPPPAFFHSTHMKANPRRFPFRREAAANPLAHAICRRPGLTRGAPRGIIRPGLPALTIPVSTHPAWKKGRTIRNIDETVSPRKWFRKDSALNSQDI